MLSQSAARESTTIASRVERNSSATRSRSCWASFWAPLITRPPQKTQASRNRSLIVRSVQIHSHGHGLYSLQEHGQVCSVLCLLLPLSFRFQYPMVPRRGLQAVRLEDAAEVLIEHKEAAAHPRVCTKGKKGGRDKSRGQRGIKSKWAVVHAAEGSERAQ